MANKHELSRQLPGHDYLTALDLQAEIIEYHLLNDMPADLIAQEIGVPVSDVQEILDRFDNLELDFDQDSEHSELYHWR